MIVFNLVLFIVYRLRNFTKNKYKSSKEYKKLLQITSFYTT